MGLFRSKPRRDLRLFFTTDLHGSDVCFRKFVNAAGVYGADVLLLGGDVAGKRLAPITRTRDGHLTGTLGHRAVRIETDRERQEFEKAAADAGLYTYVATEDELAEIEAKPEALERLMARLAAERLERWLELAGERLDGSGVRLLVNCGNDDPFELDRVIEGSPAATFLEGRIVDIDETRAVASLGYANETPWACPRDVPEPELEARLDAMLADWRGDGRALILNCHCPPHDSGLDTAQLLNPDLSVVTEGGQPLVGPVGSRAVRAAIERYRPILSLHGHIHESRAVTKIGPTTAINPGSEYPEGVLRGALVDFGGATVSSYVLTTG
jgi:Icc-related predicted phosphoesterase